MGLLSLFQRRDEDGPELAPEPKPARAASGALWRCNVFDSYSLGEHVQAMKRPGANPVVLPAFALEFASGCDKWRPLERQIAEYAELHGWDALQVESLRKVIPALHEAGALISTDDLLARLSAGEGSGAGAKITALGFPTGGNRVHLLERAVRSFSVNLRTHSRTADLLVADSSSNAEQSRAFEERLRAIAPDLGQRVFFAAEAEKRAFAAALVKAGACAPEIAEFALLDPLKTSFACGANRNAIMLHGVGSMVCSIDDDVVCDLFAPPETQPGLSFFSNTDPFSRWLYSDLESAESDALPADVDFLAMHERLLGQQVAQALAQLPGERDFERTGDRLLERLDAGALTVRSTFTGHLGDPGIPTSAYYLFYDGENRRRLTESEEHYRSVFGSRSVRTLVEQFSIGDASVSPGMAMGIDLRALMPPSFPVLHAEDFSWGAAIWQCCGDALFGHVPLAIRHSPPSGKSILMPTDFHESHRVVVFEWAHLLRYFMLDFEVAQHQSAPERMSSLGRHLEELGRLDARDFAAQLGRTVLRNEAGRVNWLEKQLREDSETPDFWRDDVQAHLDHVREAMEADDYDVPLDLKNGRTLDEARAFVQRMLLEYGRLLQAWQAIVPAATQLRENGMSLFRQLRE